MNLRMELQEERPAKSTRRERKKLESRLKRFQKVKAQYVDKPKHKKSKRLTRKQRKFLDQHHREYVQNGRGYGEN